MPAEGRENPLLKKGIFDAFFREKYLTKNTIGRDGTLTGAKNKALVEALEAQGFKAA